MSYFYSAPFRKVFFLVYLLALLGTAASAQTHTPVTVPINGNCGGYYEYLPYDYNSTDDKHPVIFYLPSYATLGDGSKGDLKQVLYESIPYYIAKKKFPLSFTVNNQTSSFIVITPQFKQWPTAADVNDVINYILSNNYKIDKSRIYVTGYSMGGDAAYRFVTSSVAAASTIAAFATGDPFINPYTDNGTNYIAQANLPARAYHSTDDVIAPSYWSVNYVAKINSFKPKKKAQAILFSGYAHEMAWKKVYDPSWKTDDGYNLYEWFLTNTRNQSPNANAGNDITLRLPVNQTTLDGSNSYDPDSGALTYAWKQISGPSQITWNNTTIATPTVSNFIVGNYAFELTVADTNNASDKDTVSVTVLPTPPNKVPVAKAGNDQTISSQVGSVVLNGTQSSDSDGTIVSYAWSKVSGPDSYTINNATGAITSVSNLIPGVYGFSLKVTDDGGASASDVVTITVNGPNQPPVVSAGNDQEITLPANSVNLSGTATDPDNQALTYRWQQIAGPSASTISDAGDISPTVSNLTEGVYLFELTATDTQGAAAKDTVQITVHGVVTTPASTKYIKVNIYGGTDPFNNPEWNDWNVGTTEGTNIPSGVLQYSDGTASPYAAVLSHSQGVGDNRATYGSGMAPAEVLRHTSYSRQNRTLTITGLSPDKQYTIELYSSRYSIGNSTIYTVNGMSQSIDVYDNYDHKAVFANLSADSQGQLVIGLTPGTNYTHLNGFTLIEQGANYTVQQQQALSTSVMQEQAPVERSDKLSLNTYPNPVSNQVTLQFSNDYTGVGKVQIIGASGIIRQEYIIQKQGSLFMQTLYLNNLPTGYYILTVQTGKYSYSNKMIKQ